ncbi:MAG: molybdenum cofactor biosynthesis protein MoaE [Rhodospirillaceae bacterium]|jgi:molybdopterin synthase catalytic subunit|nr:molybdenum cofactor biosynthesis protein MoaE [Rhodospirillaceae bacterium]MBT4590016.1 molybdenum cofactor biosynthesis protein MoaE [Rhodospirillaceae bacterium]MBT5941381.1 molybdenum cofactor biosynthesis protein MoaE [Rhodospirillaceae bacterium]MBT7268033.1 molybdenum cofactor biosynthesis protein MoaE [Rhodospirillaceae bacterium]
MSVRVQLEDFDAGAEIAKISATNTNVGGVCSFVGLVREFDEGSAITAMTLEHYPGMTEKQLAKIEAEAHERWPLEDSLIIHRYGRMEPGEQIVLVVTASAHRKAAFEACEFLIDWLKTQAPFWKSEETPDGAKWVDAKAADDEAADKWKK